MLLHFYLASQQYSRSSHRYHRLTKQERDHNRQDAWNVQMPLLLEAYMQFKFGTSIHGRPLDAPVFEISVLGTQGMVTLLISSFALIGVPGYLEAQVIPQEEQHEYINQTLIVHGLLGTAPMHPSLAIPIPTLELYYQCRLRCPQFSVQQWVKVLCDLSNVSYDSCCCMQLINYLD